MMEIIFKIILTFVLIYCIFFIWTNKIDAKRTILAPLYQIIHFKKEYTPPIPTYTLQKMLSKYNPGIKVYDILWEEDFSHYNFTLKNQSQCAEMTDIRI